MTARYKLSNLSHIVNHSYDALPLPLSHTMDHPPHYMFDNVDLNDEKETPSPLQNFRTGGGYRDWESGAPHDPNHRAIPQPIAASPPRRCHVDVSLWHLIALYCSVIFLAATIIALTVVVLTRLHSAAHCSSLETLLTFNASANTTVTVTPREPLYSLVNEPIHFTAELTTTTVNITSTVPASTMTMTGLSYRSTVTKISTYTPPPVTSTRWVDATAK